MFVTVKEDAFGELEICGGTYSEVWQAKPRVTMASDQISYMWYLDVVVKRLHCIDCLNLWVIKLIVPLSEVKSFFAVLSFYIK